MAGPKRKYEKLMENRDLERWYNETSRSSRITADTYLRRLGSFSETAKVEPSALLELKEIAITDLISDYITMSEKKGLSGAYIQSTVKAVKSWLTYNNLKFTRKIRIANVNETVTLKDERVPTQDELKRILAAGDPRSRVAAILMAHSGVRPEVLGNYMGDNGLTVGDVDGLNVEGGIVSFEKIPAMITVRPELSKARRQYMTFLGGEGCFYLKSYLEERISEGEKLDTKSPLITPSKLALRSDTSFIRTINIGDIVRQSLRKAGFPWRPYVLRSYFDTQLMLAESKGFILRDYRQFFMGHVGDMEHRYTINKHRLPEDVIENMRESYEKALKFLETEEKGISEKQHNEEINGVKAMMLKLAGYTEDEINNQNMLDMDISDLVKKFDEKRTKSMNNGNSQKVINVREVKDYISQGWEYVNTLPGNKEVIVKLPS